MKRKQTLPSESKAPVVRPVARVAAPLLPKTNVTQQHLHDLRVALAEGWEIVQPIFARPLWTSLDDRRLAFHFVLQRDRATRLLTVPETKTIARFIREQSLSIDSRYQ